MMWARLIVVGDPKIEIGLQADQVLAGKSMTAELAEEAGKAAVANATPLSQNAYKVTLARVAVKRALMQAAGVGSPVVFGLIPVCTHPKASLICACAGKFTVAGKTSLRWNPWYDMYKKALSFLMGKPPDAPNWFSRNGVTELANQFLASKASV